jgi:hypothetical protein
MTDKKYLKTAFILAIAGVLFSGYLSGTKMFSGECAFNEPCPYFLGYPACYFGFIMFAAMFLISLMGVLGKKKAAVVAMKNMWISVAGALFAGYFVVGEIILWLKGDLGDYTLVLPTCIYGLVFYIIILVLSGMHYKASRGQEKGGSPDDAKTEPQEPSEEAPAEGPPNEEKAE